MTFSIVVSTFGDKQFWGGVAAARAIPSAEAQTVHAEVIYSHAATLRQARNLGAAAAEGDQLIFLDADDELDQRYVEEMASFLDQAGDDHRYLVQPATLGIREDGVEDAEPMLIPSKSLLEGNFMVIGTMLPRSLFQEVGGFNEWPMYEDWDLWIRCWRSGAVIAACERAIYRVHVRGASRNNQLRRLQVKTYNDIRRHHKIGRYR